MSDGREGFRQPGEVTRQGEGDGQDSASLMRLFGQMMMLPLSIFVYSMDLFVRTIQEVQRAADGGMDMVVSGTAQTRADAAPGGGRPSHSGPVDGGVPAPCREQGDSGAGANQATASEGECRTGVETNQKESRTMSDKDLSDDMLKLVRYKILFVKRDYEHAFQEREELVHDNMTGDAFAAWKVAEFIQRLNREEVPHKWLKKNYPRQFEDDERDGTKAAYISWLDEDDKKYLRVYYEVLERYEREESRTAEDQIKVLKEIRDRL